MQSCPAFAGCSGGIKRLTAPIWAGSPVTAGNINDAPAGKPRWVSRRKDDSKMTPLKALSCSNEGEGSLNCTMWSTTVKWEKSCALPPRKTLKGLSSRHEMAYNMSCCRMCAVVCGSLIQRSSSKSSDTFRVRDRASYSLSLSQMRHTSSNRICAVYAVRSNAEHTACETPKYASICRWVLDATCGQSSKKPLMLNRMSDREAPRQSQQGAPNIFQIAWF